MRILENGFDDATTVLMLPEKPIASRG